MSVLLVHLYGNRSFNRTFFRPHLYVYDDKLIYKKRKLLSSEEITISYSQITLVSVRKYFMLFANFHVFTTGVDTEVKVNFASKKHALQAKKIIDRKIHDLQAQKENDSPIPTALQSLERSLNRLKELVSTGRLTKGEYERKRKEMLKKHH